MEVCGRLAMGMDKDDTILGHWLFSDLCVQNDKHIETRDNNDLNQS